MADQGRAESMQWNTNAQSTEQVPAWVLDLMMGDDDD